MSKETQNNKLSTDKALHIGGVSVSNYIDQSKAVLIGYQAYYEDGSNKFYETYSDIKNDIKSNPLVDVKQVGRAY